MPRLDHEVIGRLADARHHHLGDIDAEPVAIIEAFRVGDIDGVPRDLGLSRPRGSNPQAPTTSPETRSWTPSGGRIWVLRSDFAGARLTPSELQGSAIGRRRDAGTRRRLL